jgi:hypothetical protein
MKKTLLIAGVAGLSLFAAAQTQSNADKKQQPAATHDVKSPRDLATGQASGRTMNSQTESKGVIHRDLAAREASSGQASGKAAVVDQSGPKLQVVSGDVDGDGAADGKIRPQYDVKNQTKARVAAGDVNGDGESKTKATYDVKSQNKARVAAGDVNGDGVDASAQAGADGSAKHEVKSPRDIATGQASGKRQHAPVKIQMETGAKSENK